MRRRSKNENVTQFDVCLAVILLASHYQRTGLFSSTGIFTGNQPGYRAEADTTEAVDVKVITLGRLYPDLNWWPPAVSRGFLPGG